MDVLSWNTHKSSVKSHFRALSQPRLLHTHTVKNCTALNRKALLHFLYDLGQDYKRRFVRHVSDFSTCWSWRLFRFVRSEPATTVVSWCFQDCGRGFLHAGCFHILANEIEVAGLHTQGSEVIKLYKLHILAQITCTVPSCSRWL